MQCCTCLLKGDFNRWLLAQRVKQAVIVDHTVIARDGHRDASRIQFTPECFTFIPQNVQLSCLNQRLREAFQLCSAGAKRRGKDIVCLLYTSDAADE